MQTNNIYTDICEFSELNYEQWKDIAIASLKGADFEKTLFNVLPEGISLKPYYTSDSLRKLDIYTNDYINRKIESKVKWNIDQGEEFLSIYKVVDSYQYHIAGANAIQEIALLLASLYENLSSKDFKNQAICLFCGIGGNFYVEVAKFRAIRYLSNKIAQIAEFEQKDFYIHAKTTISNKSIMDKHTNILRTTTEALSAVIGNVDGLSIYPFDILSESQSNLAKRIAENIHHLIAEETDIAKTFDPLAGSYLIEDLTFQIAEKAFELFKEIQSLGGYAEYLKSGKLNELLQHEFDKKVNDIQTRKQTLIGVNKYVNQIENLSEEELSYKSELLEFSLANDFQMLRSQLNQIIKTKNCCVFLATFGELKDYKARLDFAIDFFSVAGFRTESSNSLELIEDAVLISGLNDAKIVVICSTDENYKQIVPEFAQQFKIHYPNKKLVLAGYPKEDIERYKANGVNDFIHLKSNILNTLTNFVNYLTEEN